MTIEEMWRQVNEEILMPYCASGGGCQPGERGHEGRCVWKNYTPAEKLELFGGLIAGFLENPILYPRQTLEENRRRIKLIVDGKHGV